MSYQIFLTVWLVIQMVAGLCSQPRISKIKGDSEMQLIASIAGITLKFIGMFYCLYMGGFYE